MEVTPGACPYCGIINREVETIMGRDGGAEVGDVMICEACAGFSVYIGHGAVRAPDDYERATMLEDPDLAAAVLSAELDLM
jgi:hypothetical protein